MNQKERQVAPLLEEQKDMYVSTLSRSRMSIRLLELTKKQHDEKSRPLIIDHLIGRESNTGLIVDDELLRTMEGGSFGAFRELQLGGYEGLARETLRNKLRNTRLSYTRLTP